MPARDLAARLDRIETAIAYAEALNNAATKGPWEARRKSVVVAQSEPGPNAWGGGICNCIGAGYGESKNHEMNVAAESNALLIAALRNAAPGMLKYLRDEFERVRDLWDTLLIGEPYAEECIARLEAAHCA